VYNNLIKYITILYYNKFASSRKVKYLYHINYKYIIHVALKIIVHTAYYLFKNVFTGCHSLLIFVWNCFSDCKFYYSILRTGVGRQEYRFAKDFFYFFIFFYRSHFWLALHAVVTSASSVLSLYGQLIYSQLIDIQLIYSQLMYIYN